MVHTQVSIGILFGLAILGVLVRFVIRTSRHRGLGWDDGLVSLAAIFLIVAMGICLKLLNTLYLVEAINKGKTIPFAEELPDLLGLLKWATIWAAMNYSAVYFVKFSFLYFFRVFLKGLSERITKFYWTSFGITVICWLYTILSPIIICPHFGADSGMLSLFLVLSTLRIYIKQLFS